MANKIQAYFKPRMLEDIKNKLNNPHNVDSEWVKSLLYPLPLEIIDTSQKPNSDRKIFLGVIGSAKDYLEQFVPLDDYPKYSGIEWNPNTEWWWNQIYEHKYGQEVPKQEYHLGNPLHRADEFFTNYDLMPSKFIAQFYSGCWFPQPDNVKDD